MPTRSATGSGCAIASTARCMPAAAAGTTPPGTARAAPSPSPAYRWPPSYRRGEIGRGRRGRGRGRSRQSGRQPGPSAGAASAAGRDLRAPFGVAFLVVIVAILALAMSSGFPLTAGVDGGSPSPSSGASHGGRLASGSPTDEATPSTSGASPASPASDVPIPTAPDDPRETREPGANPPPAATPAPTPETTPDPPDPEADPTPHAPTDADARADAGADARLSDRSGFGRADRPGGARRLVRGRFHWSTHSHQGARQRHRPDAERDGRVLPPAELLDHGHVHEGPGLGVRRAHRSLADCDAGVTPRLRPVPARPASMRHHAGRDIPAAA